MLATLLLVVATSYAAPGSSGDPNDTQTQTWVAGGARWGTAGTHRVVAGHAWPRKGFGITGGGVASWAGSVIVPGDSLQAYQGYLDVAYQPIANLELAVGGRVDYLADSVFVGSRVLRIGSPEVMLKYAFAPVYDIGMALVARGYFPVVEQHFAASHPSVGLTAAASRLIGRYQLNLNLGGVWDRTGGAVSGWRNPAQKIADGLVHTSFMDAGASVTAAWAFDAGILDTLTVIPFAEITGAFGFGTPLGDDPTRITLGCKAMAFDDRPVEVMLGVDRRLSGAPSMSNPFPGELPWSLLLRVALHVDQAAPLRRNVITIEHSRVTRGFGGTTIISAADAPEYHAVVVRGHVFDTSHQPISEGTVVVDERKNAPLAIEHDGSFSTLPVVIQGNILRVEAHALGYRSVQQNVVLQPNQTEARVSFELPVNLNTSIVRGSVFSRRTGKPLPDATIFIPELNGSPLKVDAAGSFAFPLRDGRWQLIFSAPGHASVRRRLVLDSEVHVILHIGLTHKLPSVLRR